MLRMDMPERIMVDIEQVFPADHALIGEFEAAKASRDIKRLQLFIARHPESRLASDARQLISRLRAEQSNPPNRF
jgi:hypothetical protein